MCTCGLTSSHAQFLRMKAVSISLSKWPMLHTTARFFSALSMLASQTLTLPVVVTIRSILPSRALSIRASVPSLMPSRYGVISLMSWRVADVVIAHVVGGEGMAVPVYLAPRGLVDTGLGVVVCAFEVSGHQVEAVNDGLRSTGRVSPRLD